MAAISIQRVLDIIKNGHKRFELTFVRSTGSKKGTVKVSNYLYGAPNPKDAAVSPNSRMRYGLVPHTFKLSGSIPLTEVDSGRLITPLISHIIGFNGDTVRH